METLALDLWRYLGFPDPSRAFCDNNAVRSCILAHRHADHSTTQGMEMNDEVASRSCESKVLTGVDKKPPLDARRYSAAARVDNLALLAEPHVMGQDLFKSVI